MRRRAAGWLHRFAWWVDRQADRLWCVDGVLASYAGPRFSTIGDGCGERQRRGGLSSDEGREVGGSGEEGRVGAARQFGDEEAGEVDAGPGWLALQAWQQCVRTATGSDESPAVGWRDPADRGGTAIDMNWPG